MSLAMTGQMPSDTMATTAMVFTARSRAEAVS